MADYPIEDCARSAFGKVALGATVHQKWTCSHCKSRQTMAKPDTFFLKGICEECGKETRITHCNYVAFFGVSPTELFND